MTDLPVRSYRCRCGGHFLWTFGFEGYALEYVTCCHCRMRLVDYMAEVLRERERQVQELLAEVRALVPQEVAAELNGSAPVLVQCAYEHQ